MRIRDIVLIILMIACVCIMHGVTAVTADPGHDTEPPYTVSGTLPDAANRYQQESAQEGPWRGFWNTFAHSVSPIEEGEELRDPDEPPRPITLHDYLNKAHAQDPGKANLSIDVGF